MGTADPEALKNVPEIDETLDLHWSAWIDLHSSRTSGLVSHPIQFSDIAAWLDLQQVEDVDLRLEVASVVKRVDVEWLAWKSAKH